MGVAWRASASPLTTKIPVSAVIAFDSQVLKEICIAFSSTSPSTSTFQNSPIKLNTGDLFVQQQSVRRSSSATVAENACGKSGKLLLPPRFRLWCRLAEFGPWLLQRLPGASLSLIPPGFVSGTPTLVSPYAAFLIACGANWELHSHCSCNPNSGRTASLRPQRSGKKVLLKRHYY